jgi:hypothetical protein
MIKIAHEKGYLVSYNHPNWSLETAEDYLKYEGFDFIEIHNTGTHKSGYHNDEAAYNDMMKLGKRIFCVAADDNHNIYGFDDQLSDSFGGWVMVAADKLGYKEIMNSLEATTELLERMTEIETKVLDGDVNLKTRKLWYQGVERTYYEFLTTYTDVENVPETGTVNAKSTDFLAALETEMDSKNSFSQQTMIQLQSQTTKRDQAYDMVSNVLKSVNNTLIGNANNL